MLDMILQFLYDKFSFVYGALKYLQHWNKYILEGHGHDFGEIYFYDFNVYIASLKHF